MQKQSINSPNRYITPFLLQSLQEPHILDYDPRSGDYGLGFFGCSTQSGAYFVHHPDLGGKPVCYLCNIAEDAHGITTIVPTDMYHRRVYLEPLGLYLTLDSGTFASLEVDLSAKYVNISFALDNRDAIFSTWRLRVDKLSSARPGNNFEVGALKKIRGAFEVPVTQQTVRLTWQ